MMNCHEATQSAGAFLERHLRFRKRMAFLMHIAMCRGCRAYLEQLRLTLLGLRSLKQPAPESGDVESLVQRFRNHNTRDDR